MMEQHKDGTLHCTVEELEELWGRPHEEWGLSVNGEDVMKLTYDPDQPVIRVDVHAGLDKNGYIRSPEWLDAGVMDASTCGSDADVEVVWRYLVRHTS